MLLNVQTIQHLCITIYLHLIFRREHTFLFITNNNNQISNRQIINCNYTENMLSVMNQHKIMIMEMSALG